MKDQIRIRVLGIGWEDWHHPWYAAGHEFTRQELEKQIKKLMKRDKKINIYAKPPVDMPTRKKLTVLGKISPDIIRLDAKKQRRKGS